jgi:hypothetical protein
MIDPGAFSLAPPAAGQPNFYRLITNGTDHNLVRVTVISIAKNSRLSLADDAPEMSPFVTLIGLESAAWAN